MTDLDACTISLSHPNTVASLRAKLIANEGLTTGFPIVAEDRGVRLQGYIGYGELEHALRTYDEGGDPARVVCTFKDPTSLMDGPGEYITEGPREENEESDAGEVLDLGYLVDRAPMTVSTKAPMQLLHQLFIKLGTRYLAVQDVHGCYVGIIEKNRCA